MGLDGRGVAQGGVVETPGGDRWLMLFQDHGAVGRIPVLVPVRWETGYPSVGHIPERLDPPSLAPDHVYEPLYTSDALRGEISPLWQWNHEPHPELVSLSRDGLSITTDRAVPGLEQAVNTLTQRCFGPRCECSVTVDASGLRPGDHAGICALMGCYAELAVTADGAGSLSLSLITKEPAPGCGPYGDPEHESPRVVFRAPLDGDKVRLTAKFDFTDDTVRFSYERGGEFISIDHVHKLVYRLDHFTGVRIDGYEAPTALLTVAAAEALQAVGDEARAAGWR